MKEITIKLFSLDELYERAENEKYQKEQGVMVAQNAFKAALEVVRAHYLEDTFADDIHYIVEQELSYRGFEAVDFEEHYSLNYNQGDGVSFTTVKNKPTNCLPAIKKFLEKPENKIGFINYYMLTHQEPYIPDNDYKIYNQHLVDFIKNFPDDELNIKVLHNGSMYFHEQTMMVEVDIDDQCYFTNSLTRELCLYLLKDAAQACERKGYKLYEIDYEGGLKDYAVGLADINEPFWFYQDGRLYQG